MRTAFIKPCTARGQVLLGTNTHEDLVSDVKTTLPIETPLLKAAQVFSDVQTNCTNKPHLPYLNFVSSETGRMPGHYNIGVPLPQLPSMSLRTKLTFHTCSNQAWERRRSSQLALSSSQTTKATLSTKHFSRNKSFCCFFLTGFLEIIEI